MSLIDTALASAFTSKAVLCGLNMAGFSSEVTGLEFHTAEAGVVQRKTAPSEAFGFCSVSIVNTYTASVYQECPSTNRPVAIQSFMCSTWTIEYLCE